MPVKLYQIGGSWYTWDDVHNALGYCDHATTSTTYKTIASWGTEYPMTGYCDTSSGSDVWTWLYFVPGVVGWHDLEDLAAEGYYPASATDIQVSKDGAVSNAAYIEVDGNNYYLVQQDLSQGWMSEAELLARGWEFDVEITQYLYGVMDDTSEYELITIDNLPTAMMENTGYLNFHAEFIDDPNFSWVMGNTSIMENTGYLNFHAEFIDDPNLSWVMGNTSIMEASLPAPQILEAYVTANGSSETSNTICSTGTTYTLYDASGNTIPYDSAKSYLNYWSYTYDGDTVSGYFRYFETYSDTVLKGRPSESTRFYKLMMRVDAPFRFIKLWAKTSSNKINFQWNVTNASSPSSIYFYELYTDETLTQRFSKDPTKTYESGSLVNGIWTPLEIQSLSDMPSTTTSDASERKTSRIIQTSNGSDYLWCITNWTSSDIYFSAPDGKLKFTFLELST